MYIRSFIVAVSAQHSLSFTPPLKYFHSPSISKITSRISAKSSKKNRKTTTTTTNGGGFGTVTERRTPRKKGERNDYEAFPALEDSVKNTLLPSSKESKEIAQELSNDVYDRIGQIYSFSDFNFPSGWFDDEDDGGNDESLSFEEMISGASDEFIDSLQSEKQLDIDKLPPFSEMRVLHVDPMVLAIDDFFTKDECDDYVDLCNKDNKRPGSDDSPMMSQSKTVGKDSLAQAQRTSTTWFHHFKSVPELMAKASRLLGLRSIDRWEEPQTVRYRRTEKFTWHLDALAPSQSSKNIGGQRVATLLVYLNDVGENNGGATVFRDLGESEGDYLRVQPKKGSALLFFPSAGGIPNTPFDIRTLHAGEALASDSSVDKWIAQLWLRENDSYAPTAPPGNSHSLAYEKINDYCNERTK